jgi:hypothetical protein
MNLDRHIGSLALMLVLLALAIGSTDSDSVKDQSSSSPTASSTDGTKRITGDNWFGCSSRDYFEKLVGYAVTGDNDALKQGLASGITLGGCTLFKNGDTVFMADTAIFSGLVKVRRKGEMQEYWTNLEAVD